MKKYPPYGTKRDYKKIDIYYNGVYACSTNWARTCKEAIQKFCEKEHENPKKLTAHFAK